MWNEATGGGIVDVRHREVLSISHSESDDVEYYAVVGQWQGSSEANRHEKFLGSCDEATGFCTSRLTSRTRLGVPGQRYWSTEVLQVVQKIDPSHCPNWECLGTWREGWSCQHGTCEQQGLDLGWVAGWRNNTYVYEIAEEDSAQYTRDLLSVTNPEENAIVGQWHAPINRGCSNRTGFCHSFLDSREYRN
jgi:hypothetical protein